MLWREGGWGGVGGWGVLGGDIRRTGGVRGSKEIVDCSKQSKFLSRHTFLCDIFYSKSFKSQIY